MGRFSNILLAVDFDRTLTDTQGNIPQRNLDAIHYFQEEGGAFTVATGRCIAFFQAQMAKIPPCAPLITSNGAVVYDRLTGQISQVQEMPDGREVVRYLLERYPTLYLQADGIEAMSLFGEEPTRDAMYANAQTPCRHYDCADEVPLPLFKMALFGTFATDSIAQFFTGPEEEVAYFDRVIEELREKYDGVLVMDRAMPRIIDIQSVHSTKGKAARRLARELGRDVLVCAGDAFNDLSMLQEADIAFIPGDALDDVRGFGFRETLPCGEGTIYGLVEELKKMYP